MMSKCHGKNAKRLQPLVDCLMTRFHSSFEALDFSWISISINCDLARLTFVPGVTNNSFTFRDFIYQRLFVSYWIVFFPTPKNGYIVCACRERSLYPNNSTCSDEQSNFVWNSCGIWFVVEPLWPRIIVSWLVSFEIYSINRINKNFFSIATKNNLEMKRTQIRNSAQITNSKYQRWHTFTWNRLVICPSVSLTRALMCSSLKPHLPARTCSVSYDLSQFIVIRKSWGFRSSPVFCKSLK